MLFSECINNRLHFTVISPFVVVIRPCSSTDLLCSIAFVEVVFNFGVAKLSSRKIIFKKVIIAKYQNPDDF